MTAALRLADALVAPPVATPRLALPPIRVLTCGSVDDGKSTLIGRLLFDAATLPDDQRAMVMRHPLAGPSGETAYDYSRLLDGLEAEREQGITIDIAWRYADLADRRLVVIDAPGHEQYTRNMATGASQADLALLLIDARKGVLPQTRRHAAIASFAGVPALVAIVNKMDLVGWSKSRFETLAEEVRALGSRAGYGHIEVIPVSALLGANVAARSPATPWYSGPTLLDRLESEEGRSATTALPFRFPVQTVLRAGDARFYAGTVASGRVRVGEALVEPVSGQTAIVQRIATFDGDREAAEAGEAVTLVLDRERDISRGAVLSAPTAPAARARRLRTRLLWLGDVDPGATLPLLRTTTDLVPVARFERGLAVDLGTMGETALERIEANLLFSATIDLARPTALDAVADVAATGRFVLVDPVSGSTVAAGVVEALEAEGGTQARGRVVIDRAILGRGVCADLGDGAADAGEFQRRGRAVVDLLRSFGVQAELSDELWTGDGI